MNNKFSLIGIINNNITTLQKRYRLFKRIKNGIINMKIDILNNYQKILNNLSLVQKGLILNNTKGHYNLIYNKIENSVKKINNINPNQTNKNILIEYRKLLQIKNEQLDIINHLSPQKFNDVMDILTNKKFSNDIDNKTNKNFLDFMDKTFNCIMVWHSEIHKNEVPLTFDDNNENME